MGRSFTGHIWEKNTIKSLQKSSVGFFVLKPYSIVLVQYAYFIFAEKSHAALFYFFNRRIEMSAELEKWLGEKKGEICVSNLKKKGFDAHSVQNRKQAADLILQMTSDFESFGFGGSNTMDQLGIKSVLKNMGKILFDHNEEGLSFETRMEYRKKQSSCDCFMASANAVSLAGEIVNIDGIGNRVNAMTFGPLKVILVAGVNKITKDLDSAIRRVKDIAAPMRAKSLNVDTPCAVTGQCTDCNSPMRICCVTSILHRKPMLSDISVIVVNESLGF